MSPGGWGHAGFPFGCPPRAGMLTGRAGARWLRPWRPRWVIAPTPPATRVGGSSGGWAREPGQNDRYLRSFCGPTVADRCDRAALRRDPIPNLVCSSLFNVQMVLVGFVENDPRNDRQSFGTPGAVPRGGPPLHHRARSGAHRGSRIRSPHGVPGKQRSRSLPEAAPQRSKDDGKVQFTTLRSPPTPWSYRHRMLGRSRASRRGRPNGHAPRPLRRAKGRRARRCLAGTTCRAGGELQHGVSIEQIQGLMEGTTVKYASGDLTRCRFVAPAIRGGPTALDLCAVRRQYEQADDTDVTVLSGGVPGCGARSPAPPTGPAGAVRRCLRWTSGEECLGKPEVSVTETSPAGQPEPPSLRLDPRRTSTTKTTSEWPTSCSRATPPREATSSRSDRAWSKASSTARPCGRSAGRSGYPGEIPSDIRSARPVRRSPSPWAGGSRLD